MQGGYPSGSQPPDPNLPQPPDAQTQTLYPQAQAPQAGPTLGQANGDPSGLPPGNPVLDQYNQAIASTLAMMKQQGLVRDPVPPQPGPGILESLGTFGMANLKHIADENTRREENYKILQENRKNALTGVGLATKMVDSQVAGGTANARLMLAMAGHDLQLRKFINDLTQQNQENARKDVNQNFKFNTVPAPKNANEIDALTALGYGPSRRFGGAVWEPLDQGGGAAAGGGGSTNLVKNPTTGAWEPPKPGSAADKTLAATGGGDAGAGGDVASGLRARAAAAKGAEAGATEKAKNAAALTASIGQLRGELDNMRTAAKQVLPSIGQGGVARGLATKYVGGPVSLLHAQYSTDPKLRDAAKTLASSARNIFNLIKSEAGGTSGLRITNAEIQQFGKQFNDIAAGRTSIEDTQTYIDNLGSFLDRRDPGKGADVNAATTDTPTSGGGPPSTVGGGTKPTPATGLTPGGIRFREVP